MRGLGGLLILMGSSRGFHRGVYDPVRLWRGHENGLMGWWMGFLRDFHRVFPPTDFIHPNDIQIKFYDFMKGTIQKGGLVLFKGSPGVL